MKIKKTLRGLFVVSGMLFFLYAVASFAETDQQTGGGSVSGGAASNSPGARSGAGSSGNQKTSATSTTPADLPDGAQIENDPPTMAAGKTQDPHLALAHHHVKGGKIKVMIDPGHGGEDEGASKNGIREKDLTLKVALEVKKLLAKDPHFDVVLTREHDVSIALGDRPLKATEAKADLFISIHANSSNVTSAHGTEIYFENQVPTDEESLLLANRENTVKEEAPLDPHGKNSDLANILTDLAHNDHMVMSEQLSQLLLEAFQKKFNSKTRAIRQAPFRVLSVNIPATLIELGFITNEPEAKWMIQKESQRQMAQAIYSGIKAFKEKLDKVRSATVH